MILRILGFSLVAVILLVALVMLLQRRMLYFPDASTPGAAALAQAELVVWPAAAKDYHGFSGLAEPAVTRGTVVVFHGNAGAAWHRNYYAAALQPLGFRVVLAEYPGYGGRPGSPSENALVTAAVDTVALVHQRYGEPVYLWGESLGSGVAAAVAAKSRVPIAALILLTPWDSLPALVKSLYPLLPQRLLLDRYDSIANLREFNGPVAVLVATEDEIIGSRHSRRLYESIRGPKRQWRFEGAGHNSWPTGATERWWAEVMDYVSEAK